MANSFNHPSLYFCEEIYLPGRRRLSLQLRSQDPLPVGLSVDENPENEVDCHRRICMISGFYKSVIAVTTGCIASGLDD